MFDPINSTWNFNSVPMWLELAISVLIVGAFIFMFCKVARKTNIKIIFSVSLAVMILGWFFGLKLIWSLAVAFNIIFCVLFFSVNIGEIRSFVNNTASRGSKKNSEAIFDRHAVYVKITNAVLALSKSKTGGLITFERNISLKDIAKSGTELNAPVSSELLMTIFYPGTRLHDGAVIIRRDLIASASVYFTPTTKPLNGKFGSRHRAAIGISEITDSITIVVSEETGRISIAINGELIHVTTDNLLRTFEDYMFEEQLPKEAE